MRKIPTIFERDWDGDRSRVLDKVTPGCEWVFKGEGIARRKYDGTCCLVEDGVLYKRYEVRQGKGTPDGFIQVQTDTPSDGRTRLIGWVPVGDGSEDKWHRDGLARTPGAFDHNGTYELVGPKIQGNPERFEQHTLIRHASAETTVVRRSFAGMRDALSELGWEGFVFWHPDGRMAKIKARDFGLKR